MGADLLDLKVILPDDAQEQVSQSGESYDLIIIGGGPAGMTAAVYSARKQVKTLLVSKDLGGQLLWTSDIENYMGYQYITGQELTDKFKSQMEQHRPEDSPLVPPPGGLDGAVTAVTKRSYRDVFIVEIDLGSNDGIKPGHYLPVKCTDNTHAWLEIARTAPDRSVAIVTPLREGFLPPSVGDTVFTFASPPTTNYPYRPSEPAWITKGSE